MEYLIRKGEVLTIVTTRPMEAVAVLTGRVWATRQGDPADYCLPAGARLPVGTTGRVGIEALDDAVLSVVWRRVPTAVQVILAPTAAALP